MFLYVFKYTFRKNYGLLRKGGEEKRNSLKLNNGLTLLYAYNFVGPTSKKVKFYKYLILYTKSEFESRYRNRLDYSTKI